MSKQAGNLLQTVREQSGITRDEAANALPVSYDTLKRWEHGISRPAPEDVDRLASFYRAPLLWYRWMRLEFPSFAARYPEVDALSEIASAVRLELAMADVAALRADFLRDLVDGDLDDRVLARRMLENLLHMAAFAGDMAQKLAAMIGKE